MLKALVNAGGVNLNITAYGALATGSYTLISAPGGGLLNTNGSTGLFNLLPSSVGGTLSLSVSDTAVILNVTPFATPAVAYFKGGVGVDWAAFSGTNSNWTSDSAGTTNTHAVPGATTDVHFSAVGATNLNTTITQNFTIQSLTLDGLTNAAVGIASTGGNLTINPSGSTTDPSTGLLINSGSGSLTVSAPVILGADQTWRNNSDATAVFSGGISGAAALTFGGTGTGGFLVSSTIESDVTSVTLTGSSAELTLTGVNAFSGPLTVNSGTLTANTNAQALGIGSAVLNLAGGTVDLNAAAALAFNRNTTVSGNATIISEKNVAGAGRHLYVRHASIGSNTLTVEGGNTATGTAGLAFGVTTFTGNATLHVDNPVAASTSTVLTLGALNDGGAATTITKSGTGTLTLATAAGTLTVGTRLNITGGTVNSNLATALGANVQVDVGDGGLFAATVSQTIGALSDDTAVTHTGRVTIGGATQTLTIGGASNLSSTFGGVIASATGATASAISKQGTGTLTLTGANTYLGATGVVAGTLRLGAVRRAADRFGRHDRQRQQRHRARTRRRLHANSHRDDGHHHGRRLPAVRRRRPS
ncbi:MAG: autotransporter-associated beta strand repeat-containing protein [Pirellulales bacterium]